MADGVIDAPLIQWLRLGPRDLDAAVEPKVEDLRAALKYSD
jgi:hypothetical protein